MADWIDRMLADGLVRAEGLFAEERGLGRQLWSRRGWRCYEQGTDAGGVLTLRDSGGVLEYEVIGLKPGDLR